MRTRLLPVLAVGLLLPLLGCSTAGPSAATTASASDSVASSHPTEHRTAQRTTAADTAVTKVLVVVEENHSLSQMRSGMPYTFRLAKKYGYATRYSAITHPSLPNYLAIVGGRTFGVTDDAGPAAHPLSGRSVFGQARAHDVTARVYAQSMPGPCAADNSGDYAVRHNVWAYFADESEACSHDDVALGHLRRDARSGSLPQVGMLVPDLAHDAHDGTLGEADAWFKQAMAPVFAGPDWTSGNLVIVLTADEDDRHHGNRVLTVVIHPSQSHRVVAKPLTHYSLTRLYDEVAGLPKLAGARRAPSLADAFHLPLG
ncbi:alkaline phosphatase family protein [soil metagenome]